MNVQHRGHLESNAGLTRIPIALVGISIDSGIPPSEEQAVGGCNIVVYSHSNSCFEFRKAASSSTLTSETTDNAFRTAAEWVDFNGCAKQKTENDIRSRCSASSSLQIDSPGEGKRRSIPASSELRSCLKTAVSVRRTRNKIHQLVLPCPFKEQHHLATYDQSGFHVKSILGVRSSLVFHEYTALK